MKVYITRDEGDNWIWLWRKPEKGNFAPQKMESCKDMVVWSRDDINEADAYTAEDFKKKFNTTIREKNKRCVHFPDELINSEDYKIFSNDKDRKR